jgi:hypothetical protein
LNHEATKGTKEEAKGGERTNLHRNNLAEWMMVLLLLYPAWLAVQVWNQVRRFVCFAASCFNSKN